MHRVVSRTAKGTIPAQPTGCILIGENLEEFHGKKVEDWSGEAKPADFTKKVFRVRLDYDEADEGTTIGEKLETLLEADGADQIEALIIGSWQPDDSSKGSDDIVEAIADAAGQLPKLKHLFLGDIVGEECEISWIVQTDMTPLLKAYPKLESLTIRGAESLTFGPMSHDGLRELTIQAGGLPATVIHEIAAARLPNLERLELWLGTEDYGGNATVEDLQPLLSGRQFPKLKHLGLCNSEIQDEVAGIVANAPVVDGLETLNLALGTLGDEGAKALLASPAIKKLKKLDLHHHFVSKDVQAELNKLGNVDLSDPQEPEDWGGGEMHRFISVSE
jgi:hypothetical protein